MIPKIIHYCWFGPKEIPELEKKCIKTWSEILPDFEIKFWNADNFDFSECEYAKQAYENGKYAFVSDYVRMQTLLKYGGIYLDTDVEVLKDLTPYLDNEAFLGFENRTMVGTAVMGAEPGNWLMKKMDEHYKKHPFLDKNGNMDTTTNVQIMVPLLEKQGFVKENKEQLINGIRVYERDIFFPKKYDDNKFGVTDRTVTIHRFSASWLTDREIKRGTSKFWRNVCRPTLRKVRSAMYKIMGKKKTKEIEASLRNKMR